MREGEIVGRRFRLESRAATGGMGTVFRALDLATREPVALKTCRFDPGLERPSAAKTARFERIRARFERESRALVEVEDPAIVRYITHGVSEEGEPFLVMAWVEGESLADRLLRTGLSVFEALLLGRDLVRALSRLHRTGIVHRDLKPANVMLRDCDPRQPVLVDFGVARRSETASVTLSGDRVGTLLYMAPEQIRDPRHVDGRADVFALGCVLFECLTGSRAFDADDALATLARILLDRTPRLRAFRPDLPEVVAALIERLLARDPGQRPWANPALEREFEVLSEHPEQALLGAPPLESRVTPALDAGAARPTVEADLERGSTEPLFAPAISAPAESTRSRRALGSRPDRFVGRDEELSHLAALIHSGAKLVTLWGPAGIGKTRLVLEASQRGAFELVEFVELERARDLDDALRIVVHRLSTSTRGGESPDRAIGRALGRLGEGVVVLDRVEHLAGELGRVIDEWRRAAPDLCFVVTSRERLSWNEGLTLELRPLPGRDADGDAASANGPTLSAAGALFLDRARQVDPGFSLTAETIRGVEAAAALLEGIPLAIELAAARVGLLGLDGVLQRLSRRLDSLGGLGRGAARGETQISMRAAIGASVELLSGAERRAFAECSVFAGSFTLAAAEAVLDTDPARGSVREQLESLRNKSLLSTDSNLGTSEPRFCLFSVIREYAASELGSLGDRAATRARHGAYYTRRAAELGAQRRRDEKGVEALEPDTDNLLAAIDWALFKPEPELRLGLEALLALEPVIMARGPLPAFLRLIDAAITRTAGSVPEDERLLGARLRQLRARLAATSGRFDSARADLELVLELSRQRADRRLEASALLDLGVTFHLARSLRAARDCYERALGLLDAAGEPELEARCYGNLGAILHDEEHFTEAAAYYWRAVRHLEACGERRMRGNFLNNLAVLEQELGELIRARKHFDAALRLLAQIGDARLRAITLGNLGVLEALGGDWALARSCHERALRLLEPLDDRNSEALCRARLSATLGLLGDTARSAAELNHALGLARDSDTSLVETIQLHRAFQHLALARLSLDSGDSPTALACLERARLLCDEAGQDNANGPAPAKLSDDVRITLRLLQPLLDRLSARLSG